MPGSDPPPHPPAPLTPTTGHASSQLDKTTFSQSGQGLDIVTPAVVKRTILRLDFKAEIYADGRRPTVYSSAFLLHKGHSSTGNISPSH